VRVIYPERVKENEMARVSAYYTSEADGTIKAQQEAMDKLHEHRKLTAQQVFLATDMVESEDPDEPQWACALQCTGMVCMDDLVDLGFDFEAGIE